MQTSYLTYTDVLEHLADFAQGYGVSAPQPVLRQCVMRAYDEIVQAREWSFHRGLTRVNVPAAQTTGTCAYDNSTRIATLSGATWPSWSSGASLYLDGVLCDVQFATGETGDTTAYLDTVMNPGQDVAATTYTLFRRWHSLPADFLRTEGPVGTAYECLGTLVSHAELALRQGWDQLTGEFQAWAIGPDPTGFGMALYTYPALTSAERFDIPYRRRPRDLRITGMEPAEYAGTISINGTAVTGSGTAFTSFMEGSVLRVGSTTSAPKGLTSGLPYQQELRIRSVTSATAMTLESAGTTATGKGYRVADFIDLSRVVWPALYAVAEKHYAQNRGFKQINQIAQNAEIAITRAKSADAPAGPRRVCGPRPTHIHRLADEMIPE